ncbi:TVP38/TMEM64 family protein [Pelotomaculum isophthalicicum JI]|uniref:TVP38/TMEM64 family membrane protein n=2 Tax=Pelotomaculum TaxID=191373 RepID=A0A9X4JV45_9FIRM|nr:TVP38/TMEM64 family protein [Pelotomaculum isophthalicicum]MDF9407646.1 TVP38/TMEM64 family protein [Pelotomaculum isophthalicicum JI]
MKLEVPAWIKVGILLLLAGLYVFVEPLQFSIRRVVLILSMVDITAMKYYILSFGIWAPVVSFFLMVFQSVAAPLPAFVITFANAALFGWVKGALLSWSSAMCGAALCYGIARFYGRSVVERFTSKFALEEADRFFERYGKYAILIARLLPFVSFDVVSYAAGLTSIGFWEFFWATGLGQLPATLVYSYVGDILVGSVKTFVFGILSLISVSVLVVVIKKIISERNKQSAKV